MILAAYLALYVLIYGAFGTASPFLPSFLTERGLTPSQISILLAAGTGLRLVVAPVVAQVADRTGRPRGVLLAAILASALVALLYLPATSFVALAGVSLLHAAALAPLTPTADALALTQRKNFDYGWVRGAGSAAFVAGTFLSGMVIDGFGLPAIIALNAGFLAAGAACAFRLPKSPDEAIVPKGGKGGDLRVLLRNRVFLLTVTMAAFVLSSHALHDAFAVIRWRAAGFSNTLISVLWSEAVVAEVLVFTLAGPWLLRRCSPATCAALAAAGGIVRWSLMAQTLSPGLLAALEPLHGLSFALLHLACMRIIGDVVPAGLATSAQAIYGTVVAGFGGALVTLASGPLYERFGGDAFFAMAALCVAALPLALLLHRALPGVARLNPIGDSSP